jgi:hypothetical protein
MVAASITAILNVIFIPNAYVFPLLPGFSMFDQIPRAAAVFASILDRAR